jgi:hypothetical protein
METIYIKPAFEYLKTASEVLMEYYAHCELRDYIRKDWKKEDSKWEKQCNYLYEKYETLCREEIEEKSKSAKISKKLEKLKKVTPDYSDTVLLKKLRAKK